MINEHISEKSLFFPMATSSVVKRTRLLKTLDSSEDSRFCAITAPAGFGKSTLLQSWLNENAQSAVWFSVEEKIEDVRIFYRNFIDAFIQAGIELPKAELMKDLSNGGLDLSDLANSFVSELIKITKSDFSCLVLDDLHNLSDIELIKLISEILRRLPDNIHVYLLSRNRIYRTLLSHVPWTKTKHLGAEDLAFTLDEADSYLRLLKDESLMGNVTFEMYRRFLKDLWAKSDGWPIFFCALANHSVHRGAYLTMPGDVSLLPGFSKFFERQVANRLLPIQENSLKKLSQLEQFDQAIIKHCLYPEDSEQCFQELLMLDGMVVRNETEVGTFRIRQPLREWFLRQLTTYVKRSTVMKAVQWWLSKKQYSKAIELCISVEDWNQAVDIVESRFSEICESSQCSETWACINLIPESYFKGRPLLMRIRAEIALVEASPATALVLLNTAKDDFSSKFDDNNTDVRDQIIEIDQLILSIQAITDPDSVSAYEVEEGATLLIRFQQALLYYCQGDLRTAKIKLRQVAEESLYAHKALFAKVLPILSWIHFLLGEVDIWKATILAYQEQNYYQENSQPPSVWSLADVPFTQSFNADNLTKNHLCSSGVLIGHKLMEKAASLLLYGDKEEWLQAQEVIRELGVIYEKLPGSIRATLPSPNSLRAEILRLQGHTHEALKLVMSRFGSFNKNSFADSYEKIVLSELLIIEGNASEALEMLVDVAVASQASGNLYLQVRASIAQAIAYKVLRKNAQAELVFMDALSCGRLLNFPSLFVQKDSRELQKLLLSAQHNTSFQQYVESVIKLYGDSFTEGKSEELIKSLSKREKEVLELLVKGLSNPEIADILCRSLGTVKIHVHNIYRKLGAPNRVAAISKYKKVVA